MTQGEEKKDTDQLLIEIRDLLRLSTDIALRNEQRISANLKAQQKAIVCVAIGGFLLVAILVSAALWLLYEVAQTQGVMQ